MKKVSALIGLGLLFIVVLLFGSGEVVYYQGNTAVMPGPYELFYLDSVIVKCNLSRTITVPGNKLGNNLKIWLTDPYTREESLQTKIIVNSLRAVTTNLDTMQKYMGVTDFGFDNKADTFYFYGTFNTFKFTVSSASSKAGADSNDSLMCLRYQFSVKK